MRPQAQGITVVRVGPPLAVPNLFYCLNEPLQQSTAIEPQSVIRIPANNPPTEQKNGVEIEKPPEVKKTGRKRENLSGSLKTWRENLDFVRKSELPPGIPKTQQEIVKPGGKFKNLAGNDISCSAFPKPGRNSEFLSGNPNSWQHLMII